MVIPYLPQIEVRYESKNSCLKSFEIRFKYILRYHLYQNIIKIKKISLSKYEHFNSII